MPQKNQGFNGVSLKTELHTEIKQFIKDHPTYRSVAEFVSEATRLRMETIQNQQTGA